MLRRCIACKAYKELTEFHNDKSKTLGKAYNCKVCARARSVKQHHIEAYHKTEKGKRSLNAASKKAAKKFPEKWNARVKLRYAVKTGEIIKPDFCEKLMGCSGKIQAHHDLGYEGDNWKNVMWLCVRHHVERHREPNPSQKTE